VHRFPTLHWVYYFLFAHTTLRLYLVLLIGVAPTIFLLLTGFDTPFSLVGFSMLALLVAAPLTGLAARPGIEATCEMPSRVECGSRFSLRYRLRNTGRRGGRGLAVETLIYNDYLQLRLQRPALEWLPPGASRTVTGSGIALERGVYTLPALRWDSDFPLGFWRWGRSDPRERRLSVYPRYRRLLALDLPLGPRAQRDLSASAEPTREAFEFAGCREYRDGDALRHVHPRSSARVGAPVVKEFQTEGRTRTALLVDTQGRTSRSWRRLARHRDPLEAALSLATAIVEALSTSDRILELLVAGPEIHRFVSAGRIGYFDEVLDILAGIEPSREDPLIALEPLLFAELPLIQSICLVLTRWDARRLRLTQALAGHEVGLLVLLITPDGTPPASLPADVRCLSARDILRGEVAQL
jgi:uncharacterized protein (DUF58 family)